MDNYKPLTQAELEWYAEHIWDAEVGSEDSLDDDGSDLEDVQERADFDPVDIQCATIEFEDGVVNGGQTEGNYHTHDTSEASSEEDNVIPVVSNKKIPATTRKNAKLGHLEKK